MLRKLVSILTLIILPLIGFSQTQYNTFLHQDAWLQPEDDANYREFIKIKVAEEGIYRVDYADLATLGFNFLNENEIQLYRRGVEQAIFIEGNGDGFNTAGDYIEFYGEKNDGEQDTELYFPDTSHANKYNSLFSDTAAYFLTSTVGASGKRTQSFNGNSVTPETNLIKEDLQIFNDRYVQGYNNLSNEHLRIPFFSQGEGWYGPIIGHNGNNTVLSREVAFPGLTGQVATGAQPFAEILVVGDIRLYKNQSGVPNFDLNHSFTIEKRSGLGAYSDVGTFYMSGVDHRKITIPLSYSDVSSSDFTLRITYTGTDARISLGYVKLVYPVNSDNSNGKFYLNQMIGGQNKSLSFTNLLNNSIQYLVNKNGNHKRVINSNQLDFLVSSEDEYIFINTEAQVNDIQANQLEMVNLKLPSTNNEFVIITNKQLQSSAINYSNYRSGIAGGVYVSEVFYIDELMDIFTYGEYSPLSIRRFCDYLVSNGSNAEHIFIVGKGLALYDHLMNGSYRYQKKPMSRYGRSISNCNLVPTIGSPGGDIGFSANISNGKWVPEISIGRITAINNQEVLDYLDKVKEFENSPDALWKKRILHLGGGEAGNGQRAQFQGYLNGWKNIVEGQYYGGKVSSNFIGGSIATNAKIDEEVNKGLGLITFFGHSSSHISDVNLGFASDISSGFYNEGKYPFLLLNGCQTGNFYKNETAFGEDWVVVKDKGGIALLSSSSIAYASTLKGYTDKFYNTSFTDTNYLDTTIGAIITKIIDLHGGTVSNSHNNTSTLAHVLNITLLGDPALPMFGKRKPDLETNDGAVFLQPIGEETVTAASDSFNIGIIVRNFGLYDEENSFFVSVERSYNGIVDVYEPKLFPSVAYEDTIYYGVKSPDLATYGLNNFNIKIDYNSDLSEGKIDETNEFNNEANLQQLIPLSGVIPIFPREFEIIGYSDLNEYNRPWILTSQSTDLLTQNRDYIIEIDTSELFLDGGFKRQAIVNGGAQVSWDVTATIDEMLLSIANSLGVIQKDSVVFYWRIKYKDLLPGEEELWGYSSFTYMYQSPGGWNQNHYYQLLKDSPKHLRLTEQRNWEFEELISNIKFITHGPNAVVNGYSPWINQDSKYPGHTGATDRFDGFFCKVFDKETLENKGGIINPPPAQDYGVQAGKYYYFSLSNANHINTFINDFVPFIDSGDYVAIVTRRKTNYSDYMSAGLDAAFTALGAQNFDINNDSSGYVMMGVKDGIAIFDRHIGDSVRFDTLITLESDIDKGKVVSTTIGPVTKWDKFYRDVKNLNNGDNWGVDIYGVRVDQVSDTLIYADIKNDEFELDVNHEKFPYLRLEINKEDLIDKTPPQLNRWTVTYKAEIPEGVIVATTDVDDYSYKEFYEGDKKLYKFRFKNISQHNYQVDSLRVKTNFISKSSSSGVEWFNIVAPKSGEYVDFEYEIKTEGLKGAYNLQLTVNPQIEVEHYYFNNSISVPFKVIADEVHPILDVTFDGVHIMDYDIVSPKAQITINIKDENQHLLLKNRDLIIYEVRQENSNGGRISMEEVSFKESTEKSNTLELTIKPSDSRGLPDGEYWLYVQGFDKKGNASGTKGYEIHFTVINKTTMTHFFPYPNPFSTSMRFAYTLTGSEQPEDIKIQIMTISGKIVREITQYELGPLRIGKHLTDFVWDGTDEFGNKLANGVYLYKVIATYEGEQIEHRIAGTPISSGEIENLGQDQENSKADNLFKKGWGKLYIMR